MPVKRNLIVKYNESDQVLTIEIFPINKMSTPEFLQEAREAIVQQVGESKPGEIKQAKNFLKEIVK